MTTQVKDLLDGGGRRTTKVSRKNQVTLPVAALSDAGVSPGDRLSVEVEGEGTIRLVRYTDPRVELIQRLAGSDPGLTRSSVEELRDEWER